MLDAELDSVASKEYDPSNIPLRDTRFGGRIYQSTTTENFNALIGVGANNNSFNTKS